MRHLKNKTVLVFLFGIFVGLVVFFPWNPLKQKMSKFLSENSGAQIDIGSLSASTGFWAGLSRGSLFGIRASNVSIQHPVGLKLFCERLYLAPRILPLFIGDLQLGAKCKLKDGSTAGALVKLYPFWGAFNGTFKGVDVDLGLDEFPLNLLASLGGAEGLSGQLSGSFDLSGLNPLRPGLPEKMEWDLEVSNLQTPALTHSLATLPPMSFTEALTNGSMTPRSLNIEKLSLGSAANPLEAHVKFSQVQLDSQMFPRSGSFSGALRIDPSFEKDRLNKISWDSAFGKADPSGRREFKRSARGQWHTFLLFGPPD